MLTMVNAEYAAMTLAFLNHATMKTPGNMDEEKSPKLTNKAMPSKHPCLLQRITEGGSNSACAI